MARGPVGGGPAGGPAECYLDANATEPIRGAAREAAIAALDLVGNPSSVHGAGRAARRLLEDARERVAARFGARPAEVVFTAGGTEANALAIHAFGAGRRILLGATEHPSVLAAARAVAGDAAAKVPVRSDGRADLAALAALLAGSGGGPPALVCLMAANNETGVLHPLAEAAALCRAHGALLHVDAVQAAGRVPISLAALGADSLAISGHKLGGPKGAGALLLRPGLDPAPLIPGGGQERGRRGGTEPLPAIAGLAAAAEEARPEDAATALAPLRDLLEAEVRALAPEARIIGAAAPRLPNTSCILLPGVPAETQVIALDLAGVRVSAGAACSSGKVARSPVLEAMGLGEAAAGEAIRVSLPWNATAESVERFLAAWAPLRERARRRAA
jgi:cysteine desulfurase